MPSSELPYAWPQNVGWCGARRPHPRASIHRIVSSSFTRVRIVATVRASSARKTTPRTSSAMSDAFSRWRSRSTSGRRAVEARSGRSAVATALRIPAQYRHFHNARTCRGGAGGRSAGGDGRAERWAARLVGGDRVVVLQREGDVVETVEEAVLGEVVEGELDVDAERGRRNAAVLDVDDDLDVRVLVDGVPQPLDDVLGDRGDEQPGLGGVVPEDVGEARRQHGL